MERREFLKVASAAAGSCAMSPKGLFGAQPSEGGEKTVELPRRVLGHTGEKLSVVGFPGLALVQQGQEEGTAGIHKAFDEGINYFDVAPAYGRDGECEIKMGIGLQGIDRSKIFLACKTKKRDKQGAREELESSLTRLKTDHFDLYQMHAVFTPEEAQRALGPGGAIETFLKAKEEGKIRHIGFSAHTTKGALEMLKGYQFDIGHVPDRLRGLPAMGLRQGGDRVRPGAGHGRSRHEGLVRRGVAGGSDANAATGGIGRREGRRGRSRDPFLAFAAGRGGGDSAVLPGPGGQIHPCGAVVSADHRGTDREAARMGTGCGSVFKKDEDRVAMGLPLHRPHHAGNPHDYCPCAHA